MQDAQSTSEQPLRVTLLQPNLRNYRAPVFRALAARPGIAFRLLYGEDGERLNVEPEGFESGPAPIRAWRLLGQPFYWQGEALRWADRSKTDVLILPWNARYLNLAPAARKARRRGVGVVLWGHAYSKSESGWRRRLRQRVARLGDALLFYNHTARDALIAQGWPAERLFVALNCLDQAPIQRARQAWTSDPERMAAFKREHDLAGDRNVLFISRLYSENRVDLLLEAAALLKEREPRLRVVIIGDGPARVDLEAQAARLGLGGVATFTGAMFGEADLAPWCVSSQVFCYPANIGLSILHALGYGLPVVTGDRLAAHNPEIEALKPDENGLLFRDGDASSLADTLERVLSDDELRARLRAGALRTALEEFTLERMVDGFEAAIRCAAGRARERSGDGHSKPQA